MWNSYKSRIAFNKTADPNTYTHTNIYLGYKNKYVKSVDLLTSQWIILTAPYLYKVSFYNDPTPYPNCICKAFLLFPCSFFTILTLFVRNLTTFAQSWFFFYMNWKQRQMSYNFKMQKVVAQIIASDWNCNFWLYNVQMTFFPAPNQHVKNNI